MFTRKKSLRSHNEKVQTDQEEDDSEEEEEEEEGFRDVDQHLPRRQCCIGTRAPSVGHDLCINPRCHTTRLGGGEALHNHKSGRSGNHGSPPTSQRQSRSCTKKKTISSVGGHHLHQVWSLNNFRGLFCCIGDN